ncbi:MAG: histidine kinase [Clostridiales bacterium]|nr:histidine kinase [Clostridiales bacterium]
MNVRKKTILIFLLLTAFAVTLIGIVPFLSKLFYASNAVPKAQGGTVSLDGTRLDNDERVYLMGEWEFFWKQWIVTDGAENAELSAVVEVPRSWTAYNLSGGGLPNGGYASYRLVVSGITAAKPVVIYVPNLAGAYRVFLDGKLLCSSGHMSKDYSEALAEAKASVSPVTIPDSGEHEIVVEVSSRRYSGLYMCPVLTNSERSADYVQFMIGARYTFVGIIVFLMVFVALLYMFNKRNFDTAMWLLLCVFLIVRIVLSCEGYQVTQPLFGNMSYEDVSLLVYASTFIINLILLMLLSRVSGKKVPDNLMVVFSAASLIFAFFPYFLNTIYDTTIFIHLQSTIFVITLYSIYHFAASVARGRPYVLTYALAYIFVTSGLTVDFLYTNGAIPLRVSTYMPAMFLLFAICITVIYARSVAKAYKAAVDAATLSEELSRAHMSLMVSQIQPHFLYNALNTIKYLTRKDPQTAERAIINFSNYLRTNMDSITRDSPVPFTAELSHVKNYVDIELLRFGDKISVEYDIKVSSFELPPLSVQPLVENAIKHGVTKTSDGGTVKLSTCEDEYSWFVIVEDDGIGFDVNTPLDDGRSHVGIKNIRERLEYMSHATISIDSTPGVGTTAVIVIPKETKKD